MNETFDSTFPSLTKARERFLRRQPSPNKIMQENNPLNKINKEILNDLISSYYRQSRVINQECISIFKEGQSVLNKTPSYHHIPSIHQRETVIPTVNRVNQYENGEEEDDDSNNYSESIISKSPVYKTNFSQPIKYNSINQHPMSDILPQPPPPSPPPYPISSSLTSPHTSLLSPPSPLLSPEKHKQKQQQQRQMLQQNLSNIPSNLFNNNPLQIESITFEPNLITSNINGEGNQKNSVLSPLSTDVTITSTKSTEGTKLKTPTKPSIELKLMGLSKTIRNRIDIDLKHKKINSKYLNKINKLKINNHSYRNYIFNDLPFHIKEEELEECGKYHKACVYYNWKLKRKYFKLLWLFCCNEINVI